MIVSDDSQTIGQKIVDAMHSIYPQQLSYFYNKPLVAALTYYVLFEVVQVLVALGFGVFSGNAGIHDLSEDYVNPFMGFFFAVLICYYLWLPNLLAHTFDKLHANGVFDYSGIETRNFEVIFRNRWWYRAPLAFTFIMVFVWTLYCLFDEFKLFLEVNPFAFVIVTFLYAFAWFAGLGLLVNVILAIRFINKVFRNTQVRVNPLHPDACGGFRPLATFSLRLINIGLVWAVILVVSVIRSYQVDQISEDYALFSGVLMYLLLVPTLFYLPLDSAHRAMVTYRDKLMSDTSEQYLKEHQDILQGLAADNTDIEARLKKLENLQKLQEYNRKYPVWPFSYRIRFAVLANALLPTTTTLIGFALDFLG